MRGVIIRPGESFSLNGHVGRRTTEKGFVADGAINLGVLEPQVGGGISQYATTFFNAAFFAGLQLVESRPHSFYISRYPMGREATVSWGGPVSLVLTPSVSRSIAKPSFEKISFLATVLPVPLAM